MSAVSKNFPSGGSALQNQSPLEEEKIRNAKRAKVIGDKCRLPTHFHAKAAYFITQGRGHRSRRRSEITAHARLEVHPPWDLKIVSYTCAGVFLFGGGGNSLGQEGGGAVKAMAVAGGRTPSCLRRDSLRGRSATKCPPCRALTPRRKYTNYPMSFFGGDDRKRSPRPV